jgi:two-component system, OmpR family, sensor kinase
MTTTAGAPSDVECPRYLAALEHLLAITATTVPSALQAATDVIARAVAADKADTFLYEESTHSLVAAGTSTTPMGHQQVRLGLNRLPIANGGRAVEVFETGQLYHQGHVEGDVDELRGVREGLGIRSQLAVPLEVAGERRGVVQADSAQADAFSLADRAFLQAVAQWVGLVLQRAELVERRTQAAQQQTRRLVAEDLVTVLAHDLGNYLTPLVGQAYILQRRAERAERAEDGELAARLAQGLRRLGQVTTELLDVGRIGQGLFAVARQPLDLVEVVQTTAASVRTAEFAVAVAAPAELIAEVDGARVRQALENLLANARRDAPGSVVRLEVEAATREDGAWALLRVVDGGPGMAAEVVPQLMERFVRGGESKGLGLGLYLVRGIAEAHGGTVTVRDTPGGGATFEVALPVQPPDR